MNMATSVTNDPDECIICLEPTTEKKPSVLHCECSFTIHRGCFRHYSLTNGNFQCPICHRKARPLIARNIVDHDDQSGGVIFCFLVLLIWAIILSTLEALR